MLLLPKARYNTVHFVEGRLLPKPATNLQQSRLLLYRPTFNFVADTVDVFAVLNSTLLPVCTGFIYMLYLIKSNGPYGH